MANFQPNTQRTSASSTAAARRRVRPSMSPQELDAYLASRDVVRRVLETSRRAFLAAGDQSQSGNESTPRNAH